MYVNIEQLTLSGLTPYDLVNLVAIRQTEDAFIQHIPKEDIQKYAGMDFVEVKASGKVRLKKKGESFIVTVETPGITKEISDTMETLVRMYEESGKELGGTRKEVEARIVWFMGNTAYKPSIIVQAVEEYLQANPEYTMSLCNLIWKPQSIAFSVHMTLRNSKLFDLIARKFGLGSELYLKENKGKELEWLFAVSKLPNPPARASRDILFTDSPKKDAERIRDIKTYLFNMLKTWRK